MILRMATLFLLLHVFGLNGQEQANILEEADFSIGKSIRIHSSILNEDRILNVYFPSSYSSDDSKSYPVIYLLDGSKDEDFIHISGIVQFGSFPWINIIPESIVVGIGNVDRKRDFTYPSGNKLDQEDFPTSGHSAKFIEFIEKELQLLIDSTYRTKYQKTIIGQSLGGLLATQILLEKPDLFDQYIIVSPSLWWDDEQLLKRTIQKAQSTKSIYIAVGKEGAVMERTALELYEKLQQDSTLNQQLFYEFLEDKSHGDALHQAVYQAFEIINNQQ